MKELFEQLQSEVRGAWRYRRWALVTLWVVCVLGWAIVFVLPDRYEATARVQVDTSSALQPVLGDQIVVADVRQQVEFVRQALLGSVQLLNVARETGLDVEVETEAQRNQLVSDLRDSISITQLNRDPRNRNQQDQVYSIEYEHTDRDVAVNVVSVLLNNFIEDTLNSKRAGNEAAREFIDRQIAENETRLRAAEDRLADFKKRNADRLPGSEGDYFSRLQDEKDKLAESRRSLRIAMSKRNRLEQQLLGESSVVSNSDINGEDLPENSIDARIRSYEAQLEDLLLDYTERHPDVIAVRETLERLKTEREEELAELGLEGGNLELAMLDDNPVHQAIRISLNETEVEIATLEADIDDQTAAVAALQALIDEVPEVEAELARLNRDYEVVYNGYQELVQSRETQELSSRAYDSDEVDFEVIDPPVAGFQPVAPKRLQLLLVVVVLAGGLAGGLAFIMSQLTPVFHDTKTLRQIAGIPVLGSVSVVTDAHKNLLGRSDVRAFLLNIFSLGAIFVVIFSMEILGVGVRSVAGELL
ncbi:MAG: XrtA system polysaccharide chain length determinant [Pseudomonadota bacterium]